MALEGPYQPRYWLLTVDGYLLPRVKVTLRGEDEGGPNWTLIIDDRFATEYVTREEIDRWSYVLANYGAIHAGFSCHGKNSTPLNEWNCRYGQLGSDVVAESRRDALHIVEGERDG